MAVRKRDKTPATKKQLRIYRWISKYVSKKGFSPTIREIMEAFQFASPNGVIAHLHPLRRRGMVDWIDGKARTLRPTEAQS